MDLLLNEYRKKVLGCWMGKNIGGTLGAPFECKRQVNDVTFYTQDINGSPPPNDDLDLQLVWLLALEKYGKFVNASILGEYWLSYVVPHWVEYGAGKTNLRTGLVPPLSGFVHNIYKNSCGCFIRSEIWACITPGHPEIAVNFAYEDAIVDHADEGVYGEIFCAAVESAAFVENDKNRLIEIGLSYIPFECGVARGVKTAMQCYESGVSWEEARKSVLTAVPGTFGVLGTTVGHLSCDIPIGDRGWDAPSNIGLMIIGWLYGEDDFGKSLCIAVNCGEDTDCTAATLGSILGIIHGIDGIPEKWTRPMGERINTLCVDCTDWTVVFPKTVTELTERILKLTPQILGGNLCDCVNALNGYTVRMRDREDLFCKPEVKNYWVQENFLNTVLQGGCTVRYSFPIFDIAVDYQGGPFINSYEEKRIKIRISNKIVQQQWLNIKWHVPQGVKVTPSAVISTFLDLDHIADTEMEFGFELQEELNNGRYDLLAEINSNGHHTKGIISVVLLNASRNVKNR